MDVSVVVPVYNGASTIGACLEALLAQTVPADRYEVIVVDDGSSDETRQIVGGYQARLIAQSHQGPAAARNRGVARARGEIVLFTDADCVASRSWISQMLSPFDDEDVVGVKGAYRTRQTGLVPRFAQCEYEERYHRMARRGQIDFVDTYAAGYRREVFLREGGFDVGYPKASVEDQEFSFRLAERGYRMVFNRQAVVYHQHPRTLAAYLRRKFDIGYWKVIVLRRHPRKALRDSYTPQSLKIQMVLVLLLVPLAALLFLRGILPWLALSAAALFLITILPSVLNMLRRDLAVGALSPFLLFVRALALGLGMLKGLWHFAVLGSVRAGFDR